jgi:hypothetical protein
MTRTLKQLIPCSLSLSGIDALDHDRPLGSSYTPARTALRAPLATGYCFVRFLIKLSMWTTMMLKTKVRNETLMTRILKIEWFGLTFLRKKLVRPRKPGFSTWKTRSDKKMFARKNVRLTVASRLIPVWLWSVKDWWRYSVWDGGRTYECVFS